MKRRIVIDIRFNNMGFQKERLTQPWIEHRLALFRDLTMRSLLRQVNQNFLVLLKYDPLSHDALQNALKALDLKLPKHFRFVPVDQFDEAILEYIKGADELYIARTDSDDLLHRTYINRLHHYKHKPETWALINQHGYYWDKDNNVMAETFYAFPQFYVLIYSADEFSKGKRYVVRDHGHVIKFPHEKLPGRNWVNIVHSTNSSPKKVPEPNRLHPKDIQRVLVDFM